MVVRMTDGQGSSTNFWRALVRERQRLLCGVLSPPAWRGGGMFCPLSCPRPRAKSPNLKRAPPVFDAIF